MHALQRGLGKQVGHRRAEYHADHHVAGHPRDAEGAEQARGNEAADDGQADDLQVVQGAILLQLRWPGISL